MEEDDRFRRDGNDPPPAANRIGSTGSTLLDAEVPTTSSRVQTPDDMESPGSGRGAGTAENKQQEDSDGVNLSHLMRRTHHSMPTNSFPRIPLANLPSIPLTVITTSTNVFATVPDTSAAARYPPEPHPSRSASSAGASSPLLFDDRIVSMTGARPAEGQSSKPNSMSNDTSYQGGMSGSCEDAEEDADGDYDDDDDDDDDDEEEEDNNNDNNNAVDGEDYERARQEKIRRNNEELARLGFGGGGCGGVRLGDGQGCGRGRGRGRGAAARGRSARRTGGHHSLRAAATAGDGADFVRRSQRARAPVSYRDLAQDGDDDDDGDTDERYRSATHRQGCGNASGGGSYDGRMTSLPSALSALLPGFKASARHLGAQRPSPDVWVACSRCDKWRRLPPHAPVPNELDEWFCEAIAGGDCDIAQEPIPDQATSPSRSHDDFAFEGSDEEFEDEEDEEGGAARREAIGDAHHHSHKRHAASRGGQDRGRGQKRAWDGGGRGNDGNAGIDEQSVQVRRALIAAHAMKASSWLSADREQSGGVAPSRGQPGRSRSSSSSLKAAAAAAQQTLVRQLGALPPAAMAALRQRQQQMLQRERQQQEQRRRLQQQQDEVRQWAQLELTQAQQQQQREMHARQEQQMQQRHKQQRIALLLQQQKQLEQQRCFGFGPAEPFPANGERSSATAAATAVKQSHTSTRPPPSSAPSSSCGNLVDLHLIRSPENANTWNALAAGMASSSPLSSSLSSSAIAAPSVSSYAALGYAPLTQPFQLETVHPEQQRVPVPAEGIVAALQQPQTSPLAITVPPLIDS